MEVIKQEDELGNLKYVTFREEQDEDLGEKIKTYMAANYPGITWEQFFDRIDRMDGKSVKLKMG